MTFSQICIQTGQPASAAIKVISGLAPRRTKAGMTVAKNPVQISPSISILLIQTASTVSFNIKTITT